MAIILVRGVMSFSNSSSRNSPSSDTGAHFSTAPCRSRMKCQGTMLEWCSIMVSRISSPAPILGRPKDEATRLMASVALRVKMISSSARALRKPLTFSRAFSKLAVAKFDR